MLEEQIKILESLEEVDREVDVIKGQLSSFPTQIRTLETNLQEEIAKVLEQQAVIKELEAPKKVLEQEVFTEKDHVQKMSQRLMELKTNEAYQAALKEISNFRKAIEEKEYKLLEFLSQMEEANKTLEARQKVIDEQTAVLTEKKKEAESKVGDLEKQLVEIQKTRTGLLQKLDRDISRKYEFIRSRLHGSAVAKVQQGTCQACHMRIPPQLLNQLQRGDQIFTCPSCKRLIVLATDPNTPIAVHQ
ncbi:MAG TPA: C4-type zinc ribbon domain-containing protein [Bdellovibrionota bacterium]|nr:C4-type zinc ribbon domain-containing protein [Bdellovibrionota bacterium]